MAWLSEIPPANGRVIREIPRSDADPNLPVGEKESNVADGEGIGDTVVG